MKIQIASFFILIILSVLFYVHAYARVSVPPASFHTIQVRSIDTMKYSRDVAREKLTDATFDQIIDRQVSQIAETGASHVSISTPYDEEFIPFMKRWTNAARKYSINVWFRGNFSGWEGWFGYSKVSSEEHTKKIEQFIINHPDLFEHGDIFTSCPECENGGPGDPRYGDVKAFRKFIAGEYSVTKKAFEKIGKKVTSNYYSMNGDVARLVMDENMVKALDGVITIDHYVGSPNALLDDIKEYAKRGSAKIVLGEMGAPIPDIHGQMTEEEQAAWLSEAFTKLFNIPELIGINYWVNVGGSTALWDGDGIPRKGVDVLRNFYKQQIIKGKITNENDLPITNATISMNDKMFSPTKNGIFFVPFLSTSQTVEISAPGYGKKVVTFENNEKIQTVVLKNNDKTTKVIKKSWITRLIDLFTSQFSL